MLARLPISNFSIFFALLYSVILHRKRRSPNLFLKVLWLSCTTIFFPLSVYSARAEERQTFANFDQKLKHF
jgi:hypothetical protein